MTSWEDVLGLSDKEVMDLLDLYKQYVISEKRRGEEYPEDFITFIEQQLFRPYQNWEDTEWTCEKCGESGIIYHQRDEGVYAVLYKIEDGHRLKSPDCSFDRMAVRVKLGVRI